MMELLSLWVRRGGGLLAAPVSSLFRKQKDEPLPQVDLHNARAQFEASVYGSFPADVPAMQSALVEEGEYLGLRRQQWKVTFSRSGKNIELTVLLYLPKGSGPFPLLLSQNFNGNHSLTSDAHVLPTTVWSKRLTRRKMPFREKSRGAWMHRFPIDFVASQGYAAATFSYGESEADYDASVAGFSTLYPEHTAWGAIAMWAFANSRVLDFLATVPEIDLKNASLYGFSRLGKSALWTAANDTRISAVIAEASGRGGSALFRNASGEPSWLMQFRFPRWFVPGFGAFCKKGALPPVDQHQLLALIAPRAVLVSVGKDDWWSDPEGQQKAVEAAANARVQFWLHEGRHDPKFEYWKRYLQFLSENRNG
jgi:hypothetical protein